MCVCAILCPVNMYVHMSHNQNPVSKWSTYNHVNNLEGGRSYLAVGQNPVPLINIKIGGKWMFMHPKVEP